MNLQKYRCHKVVCAAKILTVKPVEDDGTCCIILDNAYTVRLKPAFLAKHLEAIEPGAYFVRYEDGYESISPAKAFEEGYSLLEQDQESEAHPTRTYWVRCVDGREYRIRAAATTLREGWIWFVDESVNEPVAGFRSDRVACYLIKPERRDTTTA